MSSLEASSKPVTPVQKLIVRNSISERRFKAGILACFLLLSLSAAYYFVIYLPGEGAAKETQLDGCLSKADADYRMHWASACSKFGQTNLGPNCTLPQYNADRVEGLRREAKEDCLKRYSKN